MTDFLTSRATKKAYFSDLDGGNILEFQFMPSELDFVEGGDFIERKKTGGYFTDIMWISGKSTPMTLQFFVDRTQSSYVQGTMNENPLSDVQRFPNRFTKYTNLDVVNMVKGMATSARNLLSKRPDSSGGNIVPSSYSATPHYNQNLDENVGVLKDLEALLYFVRPQGLKLAEMTINTNTRGEQTVNVKDFQQSRFTAPPKVRFYFGSIWKEGYIIDVRYNLSVMNKLLVPQRLDAIINMTCTRWGYLSEVRTQAQAVSIDDNIRGYADQ